MQYRVLANPGEIGVVTLISSRHALFSQSLRGPLDPVEGAVPGDGLLLMEEEQAIGNLTLLLRLVSV